MAKDRYARDDAWYPGGVEELSRDRAQLDSSLNFMFLAAFPLLLWVFQASFSGIATALAILWLLLLALRMISVGQRIEFDYERAEVARAPRLPRKLIGTLLVGVVVMILAGHKFDSLLTPILAGAVAFMLGRAAFGGDPRHDKGAERARDLAALSAADDALVELADRVAALGDVELALRVEKTRDRILRTMRCSIDNEGTADRIERPTHKVIGMLGGEVSRLETSWNGQEHLFARRRFLAKIEMMADSFEALALRCGMLPDRDPFDRQADLLIDRMPRESAA